MSDHLQTLESIEALLAVKCILPSGISPVALLSKQEPGVLINLRPYPVLNAAHYSLLQRIAILTRNGFKVTICFYDHTALYSGLSNELRHESDCNAAMDWLAKVITSYDGVVPERVEFLMESILWRERTLSESMPGPLIALMHRGSKAIPSQTAELVGKPLDYFFDVLLGILYEFVIKPEYVFFAGIEAECWKDVRNRALLSNVYGQDHVPTAILRLPDIPHHCSAGPLGTSAEDDPFCTRLSLQQAKTMLASASPEYITSILALDALHKPIGQDASRVLESFHRKYHAFV